MANTNQPFAHQPVLFDEVVYWMRPQAGGVYLDCTLGGGGHAQGILQACGGNAAYYGIDRDREAIAAATERLKNYREFHSIYGNFHDAASMQLPPLTGALIDLGVSSYQLDTAERGFSYHEDAPLDMRMDASKGITAAEYLAEVSVKELTRVLLQYGEEKWAARIAQILDEKRKTKAHPNDAGFGIGSGRSHTQGRAPQRRQPPGPPHLSGGPYRRERRACATGAGAERYCRLAAKRGQVAGDHLPFAGGSHREKHVQKSAKSLHLSALKRPSAPAAKSRWARCLAAA